MKRRQFFETAAAIAGAAALPKVEADKQLMRIAKRVTMSGNKMTLHGPFEERWVSVEWGVDLRLEPVGFQETK